MASCWYGGGSEGLIRVVAIDGRARPKTDPQDPLSRSRGPRTFLLVSPVAFRACI